MLSLSVFSVSGGHGKHFSNSASLAQCELRESDSKPRVAGSNQNSGCGPVHKVRQRSVTELKNWFLYNAACATTFRSDATDSPGNRWSGYEQTFAGCDSLLQFSRARGQTWRRRIRTT